jgi:hypothetical protein
MPDYVVFDYIIKSQLRKKASKSGGYETLPSFTSRVQEQYLTKMDEQTGKHAMFVRMPPIPLETTMLTRAEAMIGTAISHMRNCQPICEWQCIGRYGQGCGFIEACTALLKNHKDGWNAPECRGLYKKKEVLHTELEKEEEDAEENKD